jgi:predicted HTH transcriptional regulator
MPHRIKDTAEIEKVLARGEDESVEFKVVVPSANIIARNIAAFSNTGGGTILFGIGDDGSVVGSDPRSVKSTLESAQSILIPTPSTEVYEVPYQGKTIVAVDIEPATAGPVLSGGAALMRRRTEIVPITPQRVVSSLQVERTEHYEIAGQIERLAETISRQSETIETLRNQLAEANKWQNKLRDWIWSGLVGAIIGLLLAIMFGIG